MKLRVMTQAESKERGLGDARNACYRPNGELGTTGKSPWRTLNVTYIILRNRCHAKVLGNRRCFHSKLAAEPKTNTKYFYKFMNKSKPTDQEFVLVNRQITSWGSEWSQTNLWVISRKTRILAPRKTVRFWAFETQPWNSAQRLLAHRCEAYSGVTRFTPTFKETEAGQPISNFENSDRKDPACYRPVAVLPVPSKVMEGLLNRSVRQ